MIESHQDQPQPQPAGADGTATSYDGAPTLAGDAVSVVDPRVRDAVRQLDQLSDLPPAEHVEVYESVHASLAESLAEASRQADESPADGSPPS